jgi:hypothetical protein
VIEQNKSAGTQALTEAVRAEGQPARLAPLGGQRVVSGQDWAAFKEQAAFFIKSGLLPKTVATVEAALTIMVTGYELGIGPMQALRLISVVQGKPVCAAEMMLALMYRDHGDEALWVTQSTDERCTVSYKRRAWVERRTHTFTIADAQKAGLANKDTWKAWPANMLRARCISAVARMAFPDTISGLYTAEEIAPDGVQVTAQGEIVCDPDQATGDFKGRQATDQLAEPVAHTQAAEHDALPPTAYRLPPSTGRQHLAQRVRDLAGDKLETVQQWAYLARTHEMSSEPRRWGDMSEAWLLDLYQRMHSRRISEHIRLATEVEAVQDLMRGALDRREQREITMEQYQALDEEADARCGQLEQVMG